MAKHMAWKQRDQKKIEVPANVKNQGAYRNIMSQINKLSRHNRQGSFKTRDRYYQAVERFARHLADKYNLQKFANIRGKHLASYVKDLQREGKSASTIKNELSAIRFYHEKIDNAKYILPDNKELKEKFNIVLDRRSFGGVDRTWSNFEFREMVNHATRLERHDVAAVLQLARFQGLRIHEAIRLDHAAAAAAIRSDTLIVKGKGGLVRSIPLRKETKEVLFRSIQGVVRGQKLFVQEGKKAHEVIKSVQDFILNHRDKFQEHDRESDLTFHGLRHSFAREEYDKRILEGFSEKEARQEVAKLLGHGRDDITRIYLA
jgi:integrase